MMPPAATRFPRYPASSSAWLCSVKSGVPFELRTTLVKGIHQEADLEPLAKWIAGPQPYFLQSYVDSGDVIDNRHLAAFPRETLERMLATAKKYCPRANSGAYNKVRVKTTPQIPARLGRLKSYPQHRCPRCFFYAQLSRRTGTGLPAFLPPGSCSNFYILSTAYNRLKKNLSTYCG
jgi:hypothetical protein